MAGGSPPRARRETAPVGAVCARTGRSSSPPGRDLDRERRWGAAPAAHGLPSRARRRHARVGRSSTEAPQARREPLPRARSAFLSPSRPLARSARGRQRGPAVGRLPLGRCATGGAARGDGGGGKGASRDRARAGKRHAARLGSRRWLGGRDRTAACGRARADDGARDRRLARVGGRGAPAPGRARPALRHRAGHQGGVAPPRRRGGAPPRRLRQGRHAQVPGQVSRRGRRAACGRGDAREAVRSADRPVRRAPGRPPRLARRHRAGARPTRPARRAAAEQNVLQALADRWTAQIRAHPEHWAAVYPIAWRAG